MPKITDENEVKSQAYRGGEEALVLTPDNKLARVPFDTLRRDKINYQTKAEMDAAGAPQNGEMAHVWNDEENNGDYGWGGTNWIKSQFDATGVLKAQIDSLNKKSYDSLDDAAENYIFGLEMQEGKFLPIIRKDGRHIFIDENGKEIPYTINGEQILNDYPSVFYKGSIVIKIIISEDNYITELWTEDGRYFVSSKNGLVEIGETEEIQQQNEQDIETPVYVDSAELYGKTVGISYYPDVMYGFIDTGQSNAISQNKQNDAVLSDVPVYPDNALMFDGIGPWRTNEQSINTTIALVEYDRGNQSETCISGWLNHFIRDFNLAAGYMPTCLGWVVGEGGKSYAERLPGSTAGRVFTQSLKDFVSIAISKNLRPIVYAISITAGEDEVATGVAKNSYLSQLKKEARDKIDEVMRVTKQKETPIIFVSQTGAVNVDDDYYQPVRLAQLEIDGFNSIRTVGPDYQYPRAEAYEGNGNIHFNCTGQNWRGQNLAKATIRECFSIGNNVLKPTGQIKWISSSIIEIEFEPNIEPLVLDETIIDTETDPLDNYGFKFKDDTESTPQITNVTISNSRFVRIELSQEPIGKQKTISYAMNPTTLGKFGPVYGARGCLRDSSEHINMYDSSVQHEWCCAFTINI